MAERRQEAYRLLKEGWRPADVARELGVSRAAVTQWKRRFAEELEINGVAQDKKTHSAGKLR